MVDAEEAASFEEGYINESDPSVLRFLIASRCMPGPGGALTPIVQLSGFPNSGDRQAYQPGAATGAAVDQGCAWKERGDGRQFRA